MAELSLKSWNGSPLIVDRDFPLIVDWRSEPAPTPRRNDNAPCHRNSGLDADEQVQKPAALAPIDETGGPRSCDWLIAASDRSVTGSGEVAEACHRTGHRDIGCEIGTAMAEPARARLSQLPSGIGRAS